MGLFCGIRGSLPAREMEAATDKGIASSQGVPSMDARWACALALLLLAGCSGSPPAPQAGSAAPTFTQSTVPPPPPPPQVFVGVCEVTAGVSYGALGLTYNSIAPASCPFSQAKPGDLSNLSAAILEVVWTPAAPSTTGAGLIVESDNCQSRFEVDASGPHQEQCNWGTAHGAASPLVVRLDQPVFGAAGDQNLTVLVLPEGVTVSQPFTVYVSLFEAQPPDGYTAIP